ncbi:hypothetical protein NDU88_005284 [Pleurodeles waltl]|uniref:Uncharacterized protein n=1 Tax=Pleurodeles waltl TaxID=8319 RepID=A0AAV7NPX0_PLEWA|nr:hypothetical protein NDU88_005284 [Pleurodeles waltl]
MATFPALEPFVVEGPPSAQAAKWKMWVERLENYFAAMALDPDRQRPMLLHMGGAMIHKISKTVVEEGPPEEVKEEPEEWVRPESPGSLRLPVTVFGSPETQQEEGTQDAGEVNREFRMRASEEMPEAEVPETVTKRGGNRYNLRPRITTPRNLQDYDCE